MDFRFSEEQEALRGLAREILAAEVTPERLKAVETAGSGFDRQTWARLAEANLLGLAVPEAHGGMGMGLLELCVLLEEVGRAVAPVPVWASLLLGGLPLAHFGTEAQRARWLPGLARGETILSGAFEPGEPATAQPAREGWTLTGAAANVPALDLAARVLVPARTPDGAAVFLVDPRARGADLVRQTSSRGEPVFRLALAGVRVPADDLLGGEGAPGWIRERALVGLAATQLGVSARALEITTAYLKQREQFGAPLGALPPVQHRCADAYIDLESLRWVTWQAAWRLAEGLPAAREAAVAKFWAAHAGSRIGTATQHLHGGMGVDLDYPIHRYFLWSKSLELALGSATPQLLSLGRDLARTGPQEWA